METEITLEHFTASVRDQCALALAIGKTPQYLVINPDVLFQLSADSDFHKLQEFSQSRIIQDSPKLRFMKVSDDIVLTLVERRHELLFHLE